MASQKISAMFASQKAAFGDANPDTGIGGLGEWPTEGEHDCYVLALEINEKANYRFTTDQGQQVELSATEFRFRYQLLNDETNPDNPLVWGGAPFTFPENAAAVTAEGRRTGLQIERNRFCGHLSTLLGCKVGTSDGMDVANAIEKVMEILGSNKQVVATVRCQYRKGKGNASSKVYKTEFVNKLLSEA
jgi:hypothetical protein